MSRASRALPIHNGYSPTRRIVRAPRSADASRLTVFPRPPPGLPVHYPPRHPREEPLAEPHPPAHETDRRLGAVADQTAHHARTHLLGALRALEVQINLPFVAQQVPVQV